MTKDYTAEIAELEAAFRANRVANAAIVADVRAKYRAVIAREIETLRKENDEKFARHLKEVKERSGLPLTVIQDEVLHTRTWSAWVKWRDLGNIDPERVSVASAKAERERAEIGYRWEEDPESIIGYSLILTRNAKGQRIPETKVWEFTNKNGVLAAYPDRTPESTKVATEFFGDLFALQKYATLVATEHYDEIKEVD